MFPNKLCKWEIDVCVTYVQFVRSNVRAAIIWTMCVCVSVCEWAEHIKNVAICAFCYFLLLLGHNVRLEAQELNSRLLLLMMMTRRANTIWIRERAILEQHYEWIVCNLALYTVVYGGLRAFHRMCLRKLIGGNWDTEHFLWYTYDELWADFTGTIRNVRAGVVFIVYSTYLVIAINPRTFHT